MQRKNPCILLFFQDLTWETARQNLLEATVDTAHVKHAMAQTVRIVPQAGQGLAGG